MGRLPIRGGGGPGRRAGALHRCYHLERAPALLPSVDGGTTVPLWRCLASGVAAQGLAPPVRGSPWHHPAVLPRLTWGRPAGGGRPLVLNWSTPKLCHLTRKVPLSPKLRGQFAEFLKYRFLIRLSLLNVYTSV